MASLTAPVSNWFDSPKAFAILKSNRFVCDDDAVLEPVNG
jgi:hypothetical protein